MHTTHICLDENIKQERLCSPGFVVRILTTECGISEHENCVVQDKDCRVLSERVPGNTLLKDFKDNCEFKQSCQSFDLGFGAGFKCKGKRELSDYVTMTYRCEQGEVLCVLMQALLYYPYHNDTYTDKMSVLITQIMLLPRLNFYGI